MFPASQVPASQVPASQFPASPPSNPTVRKPLARRSVLSAGAALGGGALLAGCVGSSESTGGGGGDSTTVTLQSSLSDPKPRAALEAVVADYTDADVTMNTVAIETFRAQLPTYLSSSNPPDVLTWYAGSVAQDYASKGLLLDVSELWTGDGACATFPESLKSLSTAADGTQIFVPTNYYWWGMFHLKSAFTEWEVEAPETWDEFIALCTTLQGKGVNPLTMGTGSTAWVASGWFDYLDLRVNGAEFHRNLLKGEESFDSPQVRTVMDFYSQLIPFFDPNGRSYSWQDAVTPLAQKKAGMYLIGAFVNQSMPTGSDDLDFFRVPVIDDAVPLAEECPTDGYFAAASSANPDGAKALLSYLASPQAQQDFIEGSESANLPTSPDVDSSGFSPLVQKGIDLIDTSAEITQFFNRDSSDELQTTADNALTKFLDSPGDVASILTEWQAAAQRVFAQ